MRGSPIRCIGSADLVQRDAAGRERWIMQADEVLYLHPGRARVSKRAVEVDANDLPDVVLEVDHSTDVRRWKLGMYQEWGFPEIWVLVPWEESVRTPGMTIHTRGADGGYREARESVAFPGWTTEEIHTALTEEPLSAETYAVLERVGRALGAREGTRPEDDPLAHSLSARARGGGPSSRARRKDTRRATRRAAPGDARKGMRKGMRKDMRKDMQKDMRRRWSRCCALGGSMRRGSWRTRGSSPGTRSMRRWRRRWRAPGRRTSGVGCARCRAPGATGAMCSSKPHDLSLTR